MGTVNQANTTEAVQNHCLGTVLVVDDRATEREYLRTLLNYAGYRVVEATNGMEGLHMVRSHPPDLIISDILMPMVDGHRMARLLRDDAATAYIPIIFCTASYLRKEAVTLSASCGVQDVLMKPVEPELLLKTVTRVMSGASYLPIDTHPCERWRHRLCTTISDSVSELKAMADRLLMVIEIGQDIARETEAGRLVELARQGVRRIVPCQHVAVTMDEGEAPRSTDHRMVVPIRSGHHSHGWLTLLDRIDGQPFTEYDRQMVEMVSVQLGTALEKANLIGVLQESDERFRRLADHLNETFFMVDLKQQAVTYVSPAYERVWGASRLALYQDADNWRRYIHPEDRPGVDAVLSMELRSEASMQYRIVRPDGQTFWILTRIWPVLNETGATVGLVGISSDVTELKDVRDAREYLEAEVIRSRKLEAVGRLAGGVAHDFNNILAAISVYTDLVLAHPGLHEAVREDLLQVCAAARRGTALTSQLLTMSKRPVSRKASVDLRPMLFEMERMLRPTMPPHVAVEIRADDDLWHVLGDASGLHQVVLNLLVNARHAMTEHGGRLLLEARNLVCDGTWVRLAVTDEGCGMDADTLAHIFEPFFTTRSNGTGLGLATVHGIVSQAGGRIVVDRTPGAGSTFHVYLCADTGRPGEASPRSTGGRILVVDDEEAVRNLSRRILERAGYEVVQASSGREALRSLESLHPTICGIVCDVVLGDMNGPELMQQVRARGWNLPVVYTSGYPTEPMDGDPARTACLQKPFTPAGLIDAVRRVAGSVVSPGRYSPMAG